MHKINTPGAAANARAPATTGGKSNEAFCLTLTGEQLDLSALLKDKKFRGRGNKEGALKAMRALQEDGLGKLEEKQVKGSVKVCVAHLAVQLLWTAGRYKSISRD